MDFNCDVMTELQCTGSEQSYFPHSGPCDATFGFVTKTVLIHTKVLAVAEQCLCSDKAFCIYYSVPLVVRGWAKSLQVMQLGQLVQINQREIPYHMISSSAIKLGEFSQQLPLLGDQLGSGWLVVSNCFCITCFHVFISLLPVHPPLSQPISFLTCALLVLFLHPTGGKGVNSCVVLNCLLGLTHNSQSVFNGFVMYMYL